MYKVEINATDKGCEVNLTPQQLSCILANEQQMVHDLKLIKKNLFQVCEKFGLINDDGSFKENPSMIKLVPKIMKYVSDTKAVKEDFGFVTELIPLLDKYKNL